MAYGLSIRALFKDASVEQVATADSNDSRTRWHELNEASRLELIEQALRVANDRIDGYPLAL